MLTSSEAHTLARTHQKHADHELIISRLQVLRALCCRLAGGGCRPEPGDDPYACGNSAPCTATEGPNQKLSSVGDLLHAAPLMFCGHFLNSQSSAAQLSRPTGHGKPLDAPHRFGRETMRSRPWIAPSREIGPSRPSLRVCAQTANSLLKPLGHLTIEKVASKSATRVLSYSVILAASFCVHSFPSAEAAHPKPKLAKSFRRPWPPTSCAR